jgi:hypothetical protein
MTRRLALPLPLLVLALVAALTLGSFGTANAAALTAKSVKKIAAKVVDQKAGSLSVKHAATADSATTATTATTATNATTAANATNATNSANSAKLGGADPAAYLDRIAHGSYTGAPTAIPAMDATQLLNPIQIVVPTGVGYIHVTGNASFSSGNTNVNMWIAVDSTCVSAGPDYDRRQLSHTANPTSIGFDHMESVSAGAHQIRMCTFAGAASFAGNRSMTVETVSDDFNG